MPSPLKASLLYGEMRVSFYRFEPSSFQAASRDALRNHLGRMDAMCFLKLIKKAPIMVIHVNTLQNVRLEAGFRILIKVVINPP